MAVGSPRGPNDELVAGDTIPPSSEVIEIRVDELRQLFNSIDPSPFHERDLDPSVEEYVVDWCRDLPTDKPLALLVRLGRPDGTPNDDARVLRDAVHGYFARRAASSKRRLGRLFRVGRVSLAIGISALAGLTALGEVVLRWTGHSPVGSVLHESLLIGGWVAMWRPLEIFLYDWWPIRSERLLFDRLGAMPVRISYAPETPPPLIQHQRPSE